MVYKKKFPLNYVPYNGIGRYLGIQKEKKAKLLNKINRLYKNKESQKIEYLYLECFGKNEKNIDKAIEKIKKEIIKTNDNFHKITTILNMIA